MNILITGGAGFVCSHIADKLNDENHNLILLDNLLTGNKKNIEHLLDNKNVKFIEHDVQDHIEIAEDLDFIFHFASAASPIAYQENPVNTLKAGSIGTINTLGLAKVKKADYLLASTSEIYGDPEFNTYGPRMQLNDGRVVTNFIVQALNSKDITIYGDGSQTRSFSYVEDTVNGIIALMKSDHNDVFNIGNPNEITVNQLASTIIRLTNSSSQIINKDLPQDDPKQRRPDITKARNLLEWEPQIELEDGLMKTIEWVNSQL